MNLNIAELDMDPIKEKSFKEYLYFILDTKKPLSFQDFHKHCGVSKKQWEVFKLNHKEDLNVEWIIE